jgi:hypothetical protein
LVQSFTFGLPITSVFWSTVFLLAINWMSSSLIGFCVLTWHIWRN